LRPIEYRHVCYRSTDKKNPEGWRVESSSDGVTWEAIGCGRCRTSARAIKAAKDFIARERCPEGVLTAQRPICGTLVDWLHRIPDGRDHRIVMRLAATTSAANEDTLQLDFRVHPTLLVRIGRIFTAARYFSRIEPASLGECRVCGVVEMIDGEAWVRDLDILPLDGVSDEAKRRLADIAAAIPHKPAGGPYAVHVGEGVKVQDVADEQAEELHRLVDVGAMPKLMAETALASSPAAVKAANVAEEERSILAALQRPDPPQQTPGDVLNNLVQGKVTVKDGRNGSVIQSFGNVAHTSEFAGGRITLVGGQQFNVLLVDPSKKSEALVSTGLSYQRQQEQMASETEKPKPRLLQEWLEDRLKASEFNATHAAELARRLSVEPKVLTEIFCLAFKWMPAGLLGGAENGEDLAQYLARTTSFGVLERAYNIAGWTPQPGYEKDSVIHGKTAAERHQKMLEALAEGCKPLMSDPAPAAVVEKNINVVRKTLQPTLDEMMRQVRVDADADFMRSVRTLVEANKAKPSGVCEAIAEANAERTKDEPKPSIGKINLKRAIEKFAKDGFSPAETAKMFCPIGERFDEAVKDYARQLDELVALKILTPESAREALAARQPSPKAPMIADKFQKSLKDAGILIDGVDETTRRELLTGKVALPPPRISEADLKVKLVRFFFDRKGWDPEFTLGAFFEHPTWVNLTAEQLLKELECFKRVCHLEDYVYTPGEGLHRPAPGWRTGTWDKD
jgi:hypothetical protein